MPLDMVLLFCVLWKCALGADVTCVVYRVSIYSVYLCYVAGEDARPPGDVADLLKGQGRGAGVDRRLPRHVIHPHRHQRHVRAAGRRPHRGRAEEEAERFDLSHFVI